MTTQAKAPHKAVILIQIEVHEILPSGECSSKLVPIAELAQYGIKPKRILSVSGFDKTDCLIKLKRELDDFGKS